MKRLSFIYVLLILAYHAGAQTQVKGIVKDRITQEPVAYAGVGFLSTTAGTITDDNGGFFINYSQTGADTMVVQCLGYETDTFIVAEGKYNEVVFDILPKSYGIDEVVVVPGENPAHILLRKIIKAKKHNDPARFDSYAYEAYTKMQLDLNNFDPGISETNYMKKFSVAFEGMDTARNGKVYMPLFLTENISDFYYQRRPKRQKELIKAVNVSGVENKSASRYTGGMYTEINFYENYMHLFEKQFVSPIAFNGLMVYKYYLTDSAYIDDVWCRQITYRPRRKHEYTFEGSFWITDNSYALKQIYARVSHTANVDFVQEMIIKQAFEQVNDSIFFPQYEDFFTDINLGEKTAGFFARKVTSRKDIRINPNFPDDIFDVGYTRDITLEEKARDKSRTYWDSARHIPLSEKEEKIYVMTDSVQNLKAFKNLERFTKTIVTGYYPGKIIEFGPVYEVYTFNTTEGSRMQAGFRTSNKFSETFEINAHAAFGLKDQRFKYGGLLKYKIRERPWTLAQVSYNHDMIPLGMSFMNYTDNLFSSALARTPNDNLLLQNSLSVDIERDIVRGIFFKAFVHQKEIFPSDSVPFLTATDAPVSSLKIFETGITAHIGFNEEFGEAVFSRVSLGSVYPITEITYTAGMPWFGSPYSYHKLNFFLSHRFFIGPFGKFEYDIEAGKIFGTVPFPLLKLFNGNESYMLREQAFNLMNIYEFAADEYASVFIAHHFQGLFLNKIPLMRKLKWREVVFFRGAIGSLTEANRSEFQFPGDLNDVRKPYMEAGAGIENIFNFFRVDAVWRLSHLDNEAAPHFGIRFGFYAAF